MFGPNWTIWEVMNTWQLPPLDPLLGTGLRGTNWRSWRWRRRQRKRRKRKRRRRKRKRSRRALLVCDYTASK